MKRILMSAAVAALFLINVPVQARDYSDDVVIVQSQEEYIEIGLEEVPQAVKNAVEEDYSGSEIEKAAVNEQEVYKLELKSEGEENSTVYYTKDGEEIEE